MREKDLQRRIEECEKTGVPDYSGWIDPPEFDPTDEDPCAWLILSQYSGVGSSGPPGAFDKHAVKPLPEFRVFVLTFLQIAELAEVYPDAFDPSALAIFLSQADSWRQCLEAEQVCVEFDD